jgi:hypothetical protein
MSIYNLANFLPSTFLSLDTDNALITSVDFSNKISDDGFSTFTSSKTTTDGLDQSSIFVINGGLSSHTPINIAAITRNVFLFIITPLFRLYLVEQLCFHRLLD